LDLGISLATTGPYSGVSRLTLSHEWIGTPCYAAPEQLRGESVGIKSDLYSWGLIFLEALVGQRVITGRTLAEMIEQQLNPRPHPMPPALAQHRLGSLLARIIEKDPLPRPSDATLVLAMLERIAVDSLEGVHGYLDGTVNNKREPMRPAAPSLDTVTDAVPSEPGSLRPVTVICCRTHLDDVAADGDEFSLDGLLDDAQALAHETITQFGATPGPSLGGYSLWFVGLSRASDGDARLALRAALEVARRLEEIPSWSNVAGVRLRVSIGLHYGPVVVSAGAERRPADGVTIRRAVELAGAFDSRAQASQVLVTKEFRDLVVRYADLQVLEASSYAHAALKGQHDVYRCVGESRASVRPSAAPFVGREPELQRLEQYHRELSEHSVAVLVLGEAGIGKSRLVFEFARRVEHQGFNLLEARCLPEWTGTSLRPLADLFRRCLDLAPADAGDPVNLQRMVAELGLNPNHAVPVLCIWLSLPLPAEMSPLAWSPQKQKQLLHDVLVEWLLQSIDRGGTLWIEDLHWADHSTLECLNLLMIRAKDRRSLVLMTARPGWSTDWSTEPHILQLNRLDESDVRQLAESMLPDSSSRRAALDQVIERSDGVPLYVEELAITLRPTLNIPDPKLGESGVRPMTVAIPASLQALLTSRLDLVADAKRTAQFAAALGREFTLNQLAMLSGSDEFALLADLELLVSAELLVKHLRLAGAVYAFRHALIRESAYESMPSSQRQQTHKKIALGLESYYGELGDNQPELLAHHFENARDAQRAIFYFMRAAYKSNQISAHFEALGHLDRALALLATLPPSAEHTIQECELLLARAATLVGKFGYAYEGARDCFARVIELSPAEGSTLQPGFSARWGLWYYHNTRANLPESWQLANELSSIALQTQEPGIAVSAWEAMCETCFCRGYLEQAVAAARQCSAQYDFERDRQLALLRGDDPLLASLSFEALAELLRGRADMAFERVQEGLAHAERLNLNFLRAGMHGQAAWLYIIWGSAGAQVPDLSLARKHVDLAMSLSQEHGYPFWEAYAHLLDSTLRIVAGDPDAGEALHAASDMWNAAGASLGRCWHLNFAALARHKRGDYQGARALLDEALTFCGQSESRFFEAEILRQRAELVADPANPNHDLRACRDDCAAALASARRCQAWFWEVAIGMTYLRHVGDDPRAPTALSAALEKLEIAAHPPPVALDARRLLQEVSHKNGQGMPSGQNPTGLPIPT
jgi:hypothetical protein